MKQIDIHPYIKLTANQLKMRDNWFDSLHNMK